MPKHDTAREISGAKDDRPNHVFPFVCPIAGRMDDMTRSCREWGERAGARPNWETAGLEVIKDSNTIKRDPDTNAGCSVIRPPHIQIPENGPSNSHAHVHTHTSGMSASTSNMTDKQTDRLPQTGRHTRTDTSGDFRSHVLDAAAGSAINSARRIRDTCEAYITQLERDDAIRGDDHLQR